MKSPLEVDVVGAFFGAKLVLQDLVPIDCRIGRYSDLLDLQNTALFTTLSITFSDSTGGTMATIGKW